MSHDVAMDVGAPNFIKLRIFPHEPVQKLLLEAQLSIWQVLELLDVLVWDDQPLIVTCVDDVRRVFVLQQISSVSRRSFTIL